MSNLSPGQCLRAALELERPLQIVGTVSAYAAMLAARAGFRAIYLSGAGVANSAFGLPDLGVTTLNDVTEEVRRITGGVRTAAAGGCGHRLWGCVQYRAHLPASWRAPAPRDMHLEDQVHSKRCGHRPGKQLVPAQEMCDRLKAALDARADAAFVIMARTDAHAVEGNAAAIARAQAYVAAGADMIFAEGLTTLAEYRQFTAAVAVPVLANITEFGRTPLFSTQELGEAGVRLALYPLSAFRAMSLAAAGGLHGYSQGRHAARARARACRPAKICTPCSDYHAYEERLDRLFGSDPPQEQP